MNNLFNKKKKKSKEAMKNYMHIDFITHRNE